MNALARAASSFKDAAGTAHALVPKLQRLLDAVVQADPVATLEHIHNLRSTLARVEEELQPGLFEHLRAEGHRNATMRDRTEQDRQEATRQWRSRVADLMPAYNQGKPYGREEWPMKGNRS